MRNKEVMWELNNPKTDEYNYDFDEESLNIFHKWFTIRSLAKSTQEVYVIYMNQFLEYHDITLHELYETAYNEQAEGVPERNTTLINFILEYKYHIDNQNYSVSTRYLKIMVIISFCKAYNFKIPDIRLKRAICEPKNYERPITKEELQLMLNTSPLREQAFLSLQATTGMSSKEVRTLTTGMVLQAINNELGTHYDTINDILLNKEEVLSCKIYEFNLVREKVGYRYITFTTNEGMERVIRYIEYRYNYCTGNLSLNDEDDEIFITNNGMPMNQRAVTGMYRVMGERVGFKNKPNQYRFWRSHNIRKYFYNIVEECVGQEYADEWLGHMPTTTTRAYARREYRMRNAYEKCVPYLSLGGDYERGNGRIESKIKLLQEELRRLKDEL